MRHEHDDAMRRIIEEFTGPRSRLLREAEELATTGDAEIRAAYSVLVSAMMDLDQVRGFHERTKQIPDVSTFEIQSALMREAVGLMRVRAAEDELVAIVARRHRLALLERGIGQ